MNPRRQTRALARPATDPARVLRAARIARFVYRQRGQTEPGSPHLNQVIDQHGRVHDLNELNRRLDPPDMAVLWRLRHALRALDTDTYWPPDPKDTP